MKEKYNKPTIEVIAFTTEDIITTSGSCAGDCGFVCSGECQSVTCNTNTCQTNCINVYN